MKAFSWSYFFLLVLAALARGQDLTSGPDRGATVPALKVFDATGTLQGKEADYASERGRKPTLFVFVRAAKWNRPMARFLKKLDEAMQKEGGDAYVVAVWLTDQVDKTKEYLPIAQQSLQFRATALACFTGGTAGPKGWNINDDAHLTAVVANGGKVAVTFGYRSINETDAPGVLDALKKARKEK